MEPLAVATAVEMRSRIGLKQSIRASAILGLDEVQNEADLRGCGACRSPMLSERLSQFGGMVRGKRGGDRITTEGADIPGECLACREQRPIKRTELGERRAAASHTKRTNHVDDSLFGITRRGRPSERIADCF